MRSLQHDDARMSATSRLYEDLIHAIIGRDDSFGDIRFNTDLLQVLYEASDADREAFARLMDAYKALRASYLTVADLAALWHVSERLVRRLAQSGALEGGTRRGRWVFSQKAVDRFVAAHTYSGGLRLEVPPMAADATPDAELLERARSTLEDMDWMTRDLAGYLDVSHDRAYGLLLAWHSAGVVEAAGKRNWWRFVEVTHADT